jgi:Transposase, Mutator family
MPAWSSRRPTTSTVVSSSLANCARLATNAVESLVIASFVRGLSVQDVEATLAEALGDQAAVSKSAVSSICQQIKDEYQACARRRLDEITLDYLFLDASFFRMHPGSPAEPVLAAWGITTGGKPAFIGLAPGSAESADAWREFLAGLRGRGLASPLLVISDGNTGLIGAIEQVYPKALRQRCLITGAGTCWPRSRPGCKPRSRTPSGDLRHRRPDDPTWAGPGGDHRRPDRRVRRPLPRPVPSRRHPRNC